MRFFFLLIIFNFSVVALVACECDPLQPISKELCAGYNVIFYGKVDSVCSCGVDGIATAYFTVTELYKGPVGKHVKVDFDCASPCLMSFFKTEECLIYAIFQRFDRMTVTICDHSRNLVADGIQDIQQIAAHRTFQAERGFLKTTFGIQPFVKNNDLNIQQNQLGPHNDQPTAWGKLWLLIISISVMGIVYLVSRNKKQ